MSHEASSPSFIPYTLFPQVLRPRLGETRVLQLNNRISLKIFLLCTCTLKWLKYLHETFTQKKW